MTPTQIVQGSINLFIAVCILITFIQDIWYNPSVTSTQQSSYSSQYQSSNQTQNIQNGTNTINQPQLPQIVGITIYATPKLQTPIKEMLVRQKYNIRIQPYKFEGNEWWFTAFIDYGHILVVYYFMGKYKGEEDQGKRKKIMMIGALVVCGWFILMPNLKPNKLSVQIEGTQVYKHQELIPQQMIPVIADHLDFQQFDDVQI